MSTFRTFSLKFELTSNVTELHTSGQRKIVLSLRKKFHSLLGNGAEVLIDKDDEVTVLFNFFFLRHYFFTLV
jgi:hypothetical protein